MTILAILIFVATLTLVIWQPRGLGIGWSASAGALVALATGVVDIGDIATVWGIVWNATFTFVAIILISLVLDEAGFFEWAALHVARLGGGRGPRLLVLVMLLGALVSAVFANDGAALILTPIVFEMLLALGFSAGATLAFVMAAGFIADTASLPLVISNLVNIVSADFFGLGFGSYAAVMAPVYVVSVAVSIAVVFWYFRRAIPARFDPGELREPRDAIKDSAVFKAGWWVLALLFVGLFAAELVGVPVCVVAGLGASVLLAIAQRGTVVDNIKVIRGAPWDIVVFSLGMYLVVYGLQNVGLTHYLAGLLDMLGQQSLWVATVGTGFLAAFLSSVMNNMPTVLVVALSIDASQVSGLAHHAMVYANVVGSDLGPKITPIGSLATLLWLHVLSRKGLAIGWGQYFRIGIVLTVPVLLVTLTALAGWLAFLGP
ncbi:ArsB protein [Salinisphaera shabanensis E1L3A]|uniref:Arsenical pump membrane protein n=1 Tax=Salinisphaera shabanensis E1L3A TaxID=1033802 RepID=U2EAR2_9GAMM|nr:arsenic transporter [Salinisphaera shabanensis]ERJ20746.1 ArsB protein [Salinisphaera shabanensis E1L3A]